MNSKILKILDAMKHILSLHYSDSSTNPFVLDIGDLLAIEAGKIDERIAQHRAEIDSHPTQRDGSPFPENKAVVAGRFTRIYDLQSAKKNADSDAKSVSVAGGVYPPGDAPDTVTAHA